MKENTKDNLKIAAGIIFLSFILALGIFVFTWDSTELSSSRVIPNKEGLTMKEFLRKSGIDIGYNLPVFDDVFPTIIVSDEPRKERCAGDAIWITENGKTNYLFTYLNPKTKRCEYR
jgi:hypothetical protein